MDNNQFYRLVESTSNITPETESELNDLVYKYPYFHGARILYLKTLNVNKSINLKNQIQKYSGFIPDRRKLFLYLQSETITQFKNHEKQESENKDGEDNFVLIEDASTVEEIVDNGSLDHKSANIVDTELLDFTDKEMHLGHEKTYYDPQLYTLEIPNDDSKGREFDMLNKDNSKTNGDLIDHFINTNPRIVPKSDLPKENEDISVKSISEDEEIISDTLAQIYLKQDLFDKAILIYEKLSLKYPEKSSYFAAQIQEIKNKKSK